MKTAAATKPIRMKVGSIPVIAPIVEATPAIFASLRSSEYGYLRAIVIVPSIPLVRTRLQRGLHGFQLGVDLFGRPQLVDLVFQAGDPQRLAAAFGKVRAAVEQLELGEGFLRA